MPTLHVVLCFIALLAGALVLIAFCRGGRQPTWEVVSHRLRVALPAWHSHARSGADTRRARVSACGHRSGRALR